MYILVVFSLYAFFILNLFQFIFLLCNIKKQSMLRHPAIINEKSKSILIPRSPSSKDKDEKEEVVEYSLKENVFDPFKCSPPNDFMLKLELRMSKYFSK